MMRPTCAVMATSKPSVRAAASKASAPLLAYVLHQYDWSETSLIVELFTRAQGRVVVAAKGAKRPTSQLRSVLLPFQPVLALLGKVPAEEDAEVRTLRSAEWAGGTALLPPSQLLAGFYLNELLLKLLARQDPHPAVFDAYAQTLAALAACAPANEAAVLRAFELLLLRALGVLPELTVATLTAQPLQAQTLYTLHPEAGVMQDREGLPGSAWVALEAALLHAQSRGDAEALRQVCSAQAQALRQPLRALLHYHLGHKPLRTRQVWQGVQKLSETLPA
jgi:DNA repair protein RecO (recombination protein O)